VSALVTAADFPRTRWTSVLQVRQGSHDSEGQKALAELCQIYWHPLYAYARRCGQSSEDAEDLTQGFFARLLERNLFSKADPSRGRLRSFLLGAFKNYMSEEWRRGVRQKRGGGQTPLPLHELRNEQLDCAAPGSPLAKEPDALFDRIWFEALLERAMKRLEEEYRKRGKIEVFLNLQEFLAWNQKDTRLAKVGEEINMSPGAVRVALLRMRQRFRQLIEEEVAVTVGRPEEASEELAYLLRSLSS
jgi:RNA polymerase sigma-70 factor (ECF subfamily)